MRVNSEIEQLLMPLVLRVGMFQNKKVKDHSLADIASMLKYELHLKDTVMTDLGKYFQFH